MLFDEIVKVFCNVFVDLLSEIAEYGVWGKRSCCHSHWILDQIFSKKILLDSFFFIKQIIKNDTRKEVTEKTKHFPLSVVAYCKRSLMGGAHTSNLRLLILCTEVSLFPFSAYVKNYKSIRKYTTHLCK